MHATPAFAEAERGLVVDPHDDTRRLYTSLLQPLDLDIDEAIDGADALAQALAHPPALVVTEARLPRIDGYALCSLLRQEPATRNAAILMVTASPMPDEMQRAADAGVNAVLTKPCLVESVLAKARALLAESRALKEKSVAIHDRVARQLQHAQALIERNHATKQRTMSRMHSRARTIAPPNPPPSLRCPQCDATLTYRESFIGGVSAKFAEQWDTFTCACGRFEYRHRTRTLRRW